MSESEEAAMAETMNLALEKAAPVMTYGGAGTTVMYGLDWNMIGVLVGIAIGLAGLYLQRYYKKRELEMSLYYKKREDERQQQLHDLQMILQSDRPQRLGDHQT